MGAGDCVCGVCGHLVGCAVTRARETHRHDVHVGETYADDEIPSPFAELLARERKSDAPVGILDELLARPRRTEDDLEALLDPPRRDIGTWACMVCNGRDPSCPLRLW